MVNLESGKRLADRYLLQERLGDGGHAEVWAALDTRDGARVALKFLHLASCGADDCWRVLQHEAAMSQRLDFPGVLRVAAPERDGSLVFLPMECADGGDVRSLRGAPWRQVLPVLLQVARILEHAHSRGVVHRDIKPGNVLFGADGAVRLTDFGTAARTGSTLALADGSPFSASPQQLAGEAATTADDVYGLGALAYELLSRYPPYYPDFDARRVKDEMPAPLVAMHPAPPQLLAFVMSMLERDARQRPDLRQVIDFFTQCLAQEAQQVAGAAMVVDEAQVKSEAPASAGGLRFAMVGLVVVAVAAVAMFMWLPTPSADVQKSSPQARSQMPARSQTASASEAATGVPAKAEQPAAQDSKPQSGVAPAATLEQELAAGRAALSASQPAIARAAFERALRREPGNAAARTGVAASERLAHLLDAYSEGLKAETAGNLDAATARYAAALAMDRQFVPAQAGMARMHAAARRQSLESALAQGASALAAGRVDQADVLYQRAAALGGDDPRVKDAQQRIAEIRRSDRNARDLARGAELEGLERWQEAQDHYREVLARDDSLRFALDGEARSARRAELDRELQGYLDRPDRLVAPAVRAAAGRALARGEATTAPGARLAGQLRQLRARFEQLDVKVRVAISSDNATVVSVAPVGELGAFSHREVELPPGQYTVIGRRDGFRDVRRDLDITPGQQQVSVNVQCNERI